MINNVTLMGRLTFDPEIKVTPNGVFVCRFAIAVDRNYKTGEERKTNFIDCVAWRGTAEFLGKYFHKGSMIALTGEIQTDIYTDQNGNKRKSFDVVVKDVSFCGSKEKSNLDVVPDENTEFEEIDTEDDLPF